MGTFEEEFEPAFIEIGRSLIGSLPDSWTKAELRVDLQETEEGRKLAQRISSPDLPQETIKPTAELARAVRALYVICRNHDQAWTDCTLSLERDEEGTGAPISTWNRPTKGRKTLGNRSPKLDPSSIRNVCHRSFESCLPDMPR